jgi:uncharacterized protein
VPDAPAFGHLTARPVVEGWFTTGERPALLGARCAGCAAVWFPRLSDHCPNPACSGPRVETVELSRRGTVWSFTDARYQPPPPYVPPPGDYEPFAIAAVELPEGLVVLGQLTQGCGVGDVRVGSQVELVVEPLYADDEGVRLVWRWQPVTELGEEADQ